MSYPDAACRGADTNLFYADEHDVQVTAVDICDSCPVQVRCTVDYLRDPDGVHGTTARARGRLAALVAAEVVDPSDDEVVRDYVRGANEAVRDPRAAREAYVDWRSKPDEWVRDLRQWRVDHDATAVLTAWAWNIAPATAARLLNGDLRPEAGGPILSKPAFREDYEEARRLRAAGVPVDDVADRLGLSRKEVQRATKGATIEDLRRRYATAV